jgi:polynucleotide 5'-kinase involved in rRNA processing
VSYRPPPNLSCAVQAQHLVVGQDVREREREKGRSMRERERERERGYEKKVGNQVIKYFHVMNSLATYTQICGVRCKDQ